MKYCKGITIATIALTISLVGCSSSDNSTNIDQVSAPTDQPGSPTNETNTAAPGVNDTGGSVASAGDPALNGTWISACEGDGGDGYEQDTAVFSSTMVTSTTVTYSDSTCSTLDAAALVLAITFSLEFPSGVVETGLGNARFIDFTAETFTLDGGSPMQVPETDSDTVFDIYLVSGDTLYFGLDELGLTSETRPTQLDTSAPFTRQ